MRAYSSPDEAQILDQNSFLTFWVDAWAMANGGGAIVSLEGRKLLATGASSPLHSRNDVVLIGFVDFLNLKPLEHPSLTYIVPA